MLGVLVLKDERSIMRVDVFVFYAFDLSLPSMFTECLAGFEKGFFSSTELSSRI